MQNDESRAVLQSAIRNLQSAIGLPATAGGSDLSLVALQLQEAKKRRPAGRHSNSLTLVRRLFLSGGFFPQHEDRAAAFAPAPLGLGLDERGARAYAGDAAPLERLLVAGVEAQPVVFERECEIARVVQVNAQADARGLCVAADVADGLLHDAVDLHLHAGREREPLF